MSDNLIIENIITYIQSDYCHYALMLDGGWGSGKTYFVNEYIIPEIKKLEFKKESEKESEKTFIKKFIPKEKSREEEKEEEKETLKPIYISLFGVNTTEEIKKRFFLK